jgi:hypothetical protein
MLHFPLAPQHKNKKCSVCLYNVTRADAMQALYDGGTVSATFTVFSDFVTYTSGVYKHVSGSELGGQCTSKVNCKKFANWAVHFVCYVLCVLIAFCAVCIASYNCGTAFI